jgi:hypothetical protein
MPAADDGTIQIGVATYSGRHRAEPPRLVIHALAVPPLDVVDAHQKRQLEDRERREREEQARVDQAARLDALAAYDCAGCGLESLTPRVCSHCGANGVGQPMTAGARR